MGLVNVEKKRFWFATWPRGWCVTWLYKWGTFILSHWSAKFGVHRLCEREDVTFFFVMWPQYRSVTWLCGWGPLVLSHHPAKFGVQRPYGAGNNGVCNISSNSNSNAEVPMSRFTNGHFTSRIIVWLIPRAPLKITLRWLAWLI